MVARIVGFSKLISFYLVLALTVGPGIALAADAGETPNNSLPLPNDMVWALAASAIVPLFTYVINKYGAHTSEKIKGAITLGAGAVTSGLVQAITAGGVGFNGTTLQYVIFGLFTAFGAHKVYLATTIAQTLGAGQNKAWQVAGPLQAPPA